MQIVEHSLPKLIEAVDGGALQLPRFQREFVWDVSKIHKLLVSLFKERPIGMATSWRQPENRPHTDPVKFSIDDSPERTFGTFRDNPAVMKLVLDGRQRITTLLHVFTDQLHARNGKYTHANRWFINLDKELGSDDSIECCKITKLQEKRLDTIANALSQGRYPLDAWKAVITHSQLIRKDGTYSADGKPPEDVLDKRTAVLQQAMEIVTAFKFPIAEISETFDLSEVCEIFEILNTTGTRVSVFDLIHNYLFASNYDLRDVQKEQSKQLPGSRLFEQQPPEFYSQMVTTAWLARDPDRKPVGRDGTKLDNIKARNLLHTPIEAYRHFELALDDGNVQSALDDLYKSLGGEFPADKAPYPVTLTLFIAIWLALETADQRARLRRIFRAYYYRNALLKRYTQGYLNKHSSDLEFLLREVRREPGKNLDEWAAAVRPHLDAHFASEPGDDAHVAAATILEHLRLEKPPEGAPGELYALFLLTRHNRDLLTGAQLNVFLASPDSDSVEIHHLYPKNWLKTSQASYPDQFRGMNCLANQVPLSRASNNFWKDKSPNTALQQRGKTYANSHAQFSAADIDQHSFEILTKPSQPTPEDINAVWDARARAMARTILLAQQVDFNGFDA